MTMNQSPIPDFDQEMVSTRKILERVPEAKFAWKPHEKSMTLGRLASHVIDAPSWAATALTTEVLELGPEFKPFVATTTAELLAAFDKGMAEAKTAFETATPESLKVEWSLVFGGKKVMSMPRAAVLRSVVLNHHIHHRAQLGVYLRLLDVEIPGMYGPSADEPSGF